MTAVPSLLGSVRVTLPLRTVTEGNAKEHWRTRAARAKRQRAGVREVLPLHIYAAGWQPIITMSFLPCGALVTLTRLSPGQGLDPHDNLPSSMKHIVDEIAALLGLKDDRDPRVTWAYDQRKTKRGGLTPYGVEVRIECRSARR